MLNQVTRALASLIRPIASRSVQTDKSSADRDAMGQAYENLHQNQNSQGQQEEAAKEPETPEQLTPELQPVAQQSGAEGVVEARKKAIGISQAWMTIVQALQRDKTGSNEPLSRGAGPAAYQKANTGTSKVARAKKGVIVDKKAA